VVGHQHPGVADIAIGGERAGHVDVALVGERLDEVDFPPLMLRKCTLKILPRSPDRRITSRALSAVTTGYFFAHGEHRLSRRLSAVGVAGIARADASDQGLRKVGLATS
jgi:hypothetical protein